MANYVIVVDSGAATAFAQGNKKIRVTVEKALRAGIPLAVPTIVIAESTTGTARDALMNRFLKNCSLIELGERAARDAAALRYACRGASVADTIVVATADAFSKAIIYTTDPDDLKPLAAVENRSSVVAI